MSNLFFGYATSVFGKFRTTMNIGNAIGRSLTVFCKPRRRMTRIKRERLLHAS